MIDTHHIVGRSPGQAGDRHRTIQPHPPPAQRQKQGNPAQENTAQPSILNDRLFCTVENRVAEAGDILFSVRASVGRMNIADKKIVIGRGVSAIRHNDGHQPFLWEQLRNHFTKVDMIGNGAIFASVTKADMQNIDILCPLESLIVRADEYLAPLHDEIGVLSRQIINLRHTRDLLLPRLLSGQIDVEAMSA